MTAEIATRIVSAFCPPIIILNAIAVISSVVVASAPVELSLAAAIAGRDSNLDEEISSML